MVQLLPEVTAFLEEQPKLFIDGQFVDAQSGKTFDTINPANGEVLAKVSEGDSLDIDIAVQAAKQAFEAGPWNTMSAADRSRLIFRLSVLIEEN